LTYVIKSLTNRRKKLNTKTYFTNTGRTFAEKVLNAAANVPVEYRTDFLIMLQSSAATLRMQKIRSAGYDNKAAVACSMDVDLEENNNASSSINR
jgi:hypothetical protein